MTGLKYFFAKGNLSDQIWLVFLYCLQPLNKICKLRARSCRAIYEQQNQGKITLLLYYIDFIFSEANLKSEFISCIRCRLKKFPQDQAFLDVTIIQAQKLFLTKTSFVKILQRRTLSLSTKMKKVYHFACILARLRDLINRFCHFQLIILKPQTDLQILYNKV